MSRGACTFRQRDVAAAIKAARDAGVKVVRVEIEKSGKIVLITSNSNSAEPEAKQEGANEWDEN